MDEKQKDTQRCIDELEAALLDYIEMYGPTEKAKRAIDRAAARRAVLGIDFAQ
ncbi:MULTISPECIES: hypothetical protein [Shimia]|uniref:hypothetical protein n=1 Tax=Shimia TaxID=573139 RepID=UPI001FB3AC5E|nr:MULTISPECIES: hypothetical protein [Shimia]MDV4146657.1 hypothetical protein [Shimia sp. FJ5]